jgi:hypothetical protein
MGRRAYLLILMTFLMCTGGVSAGGFQQAPGGAAATGARLTGRVTDPQASALAGVTITIEGPGGRRRVVTDHEGEYRFDGLAPGGYAVAGELVGFVAGTRTAYMPTPSSVVDVSFSLMPACLEEVIRVSMPLEFVARNTDLVARVRLVSRGELVQWVQPPCSFMGREHVVAVDEVLSVHPGPWNTSAVQTIVAADGFAMTAVGSDYLVFLTWSEPMRRLVPYDPALNLRLPAGRISATHSSVAELNGLSSEDSLRVLRHLVNQAAPVPPPSLSLADLTVPPGRLLPGCTINPRVSETSADGKVANGLWAALPISSNPWQGTDSVVTGQIHERMFGRPISDAPLASRREMAMSRLKAADEMVESYAAVYREATSHALTTVAAVRFRDEGVAARWWRQRLFHGMQSILEGAIVASVSGAPNPCLPVIAAHVRSVQP